MAELNIRWESVERVSKPETAVVTGASAADIEEAADVSPLVWSDKPILVYVCDEAAGCDGFDKLEEVILKDEKVGLGMKAFRTVKMHPDDAAADTLLADEGKTVPRMLLVNPSNLKVIVLEGSKLKASTLFKSMTKVSAKFWKERLDKTVKTHLKLLTEQDQIANAEKVILGKIQRLASDEGAKAARDVAELREEQAEIRTQLQTIQTQQRDLWKLTPKQA